MPVPTSKVSKHCRIVPHPHLIVIGILSTSNPLVAFKDCDVAILVGAMPRKEGMQRKDLLKANAAIFKIQGQAIDLVAHKSVKVTLESYLIASRYLVGAGCGESGEY